MPRIVPFPVLFICKEEDPDAGTARQIVARADGKAIETGRQGVAQFFTAAFDLTIGLPAEKWSSLE